MQQLHMKVLRTYCMVQQSTSTIMCNTKCHLSHAAITFYIVDFVASGITLQVFA